MSVVVSFNEGINGRDIRRLGSLMTDDHAFVDTDGVVVSGRRGCIEAWRGFFASFPDYRNVFAELTEHGDVVAVVGHSVCAEPSLAGPALWTARITDGKVAEWRVHTDTPGNRAQLGIGA